MPKLIVITPTKDRPCLAARHSASIRATADDTEVWYYLDHKPGEAVIADYERELDGCRWQLAGEPTRACPIANYYALEAAAAAPYVILMGDDVIARTPHWDTLLTDVLKGKPGVSYGNDLLQRQALATAAVIDSRIISALGYISPAGLMHVYVDSFWMELGRSFGNLRYLDEVILEHMHVTAGKAPRDTTYAHSDTPEVWNSDLAVYNAFMEKWPGELARIRSLM